MYRSFWLTYTGGGNFNLIFIALRGVVLIYYWNAKTVSNSYCRNLLDVPIPTNQNVWLVYELTKNKLNQPRIAINVCS
jgi:hypothetical protein